MTESRIFENERVAVDGKAFEGCIFKNAVLVYSGGELPKLDHCVFNGYRWEFEGAAKTTLELLRALYQGGDHYTVADVFAAIQAPPPEIPEPISSVRN